MRVQVTVSSWGTHTRTVRVTWHGTLRVSHSVYVSVRFSSLHSYVHTLTFSSFHSVRHTGTLHVTFSSTQTFLQTLVGQHSYCGQWTQTLWVRVWPQLSLQALLQ